MLNPKYCRMYSVLPGAVAHTVQIAGRMATLAGACGQSREQQV